MAEPAVKPERKKRGAKTTANPTDRRGKNMEKVKERMRILLAKGRQKENEELEEALKKEEALKAQEVKAQASKIENQDYTDSDSDESEEAQVLYVEDLPKEKPKLVRQNATVKPAKPATVKIRSRQWQPEPESESDLSESTDTTDLSESTDLGDDELSESTDTSESDATPRKIKSLKKIVKKTIKKEEKKTRKRLLNKLAKNKKAEAKPEPEKPVLAPKPALSNPVTNRLKGLARFWN